MENEVIYKGCIITKRENRDGRDLYYAYRIVGHYIDAKIEYLGMGQTLRGAKKWVDIKTKEVA